MKNAYRISWNTCAISFVVIQFIVVGISRGETRVPSDGDLELLDDPFHMQMTFPSGQFCGYQVDGVVAFDVKEVTIKAISEYPGGTIRFIQGNVLNIYSPSQPAFVSKVKPKTRQRIVEYRSSFDSEAGYAPIAEPGIYLIALSQPTQGDLLVRKAVWFGRSTEVQFQYFGLEDHSGKASMMTANFSELPQVFEKACDDARDSNPLK